MTRHVGRPEEVIRWFMDQDRTHGRARNSPSVLFEGKSLWSYGRHFLAARFHLLPGGGAVLFIQAPEAAPSATTRVRLWETRRIAKVCALATHIFYANPESPDAAVSDLQARALAQVSAAAGSQSQSERMRVARMLFEQAADLSRIFGLPAVEVPDCNVATSSLLQSAIDAHYSRRAARAARTRETKAAILRGEDVLAPFLSAAGLDNLVCLHAIDSWRG